MWGSLSSCKHIYYVLDSLFHEVVNTTNTPVGVESGGAVYIHKVEGCSDSKMHVAIWNSDHTYHIMQLNPSPILPASHVVIPCWLSVCPGKMEPFIGHPAK